MKITDIKCAVIADSPVVRIVTDEGIDEPPKALAAALQAAGIPAERFRPLQPGEAWTPSA